MSPKLKMFSKNKIKNKNTTNNTNNHRKSTSTQSTSVSPTTTSHPSTYATTASHPSTYTSTTSLSHSTTFPKTYTHNPTPTSYHIHLSQPPGRVEGLGVWGCLIVGALPVWCVVVVVGMICAGCFIVTGSVLLLIQMSCLAFMGCVLVPVGVLTALFVGLPPLVFYGIYTSCSFLFSLF